MSTISLALHVTAAAVLVGPQLLMFFAVIPATWFIDDDERLKRAVLGTITRRFGMLAGVSLVVLILTGLHQYFQVPAEIRTGDGYPFASLFFSKMALLGVLLLLIGFHTFRFSRRITEMSDAVIAGRGNREELTRLRLRSFSFSIVILLVSVVILWLGVAMGNHEFSRSLMDLA